MFQSAATLAYDAGDLNLAEHLIHDGLLGLPPARVKQELKDLYEQVTAHAHLSTRGIELTPQEFQIALVGEEVGSGQVLWSEFRRRGEAIAQLVERTASRLLGEPFRPRSGWSAPFQPFITSPRPGSFATTVTLGYRPGQMQMLTTADEVIDAVAEGIQLLEAKEFEVFQARFKEPAYLRHFVSQAKELAPDGSRITQVALTTPRRRVSMERPRSESPVISGGDDFLALSLPEVKLLQITTSTRPPRPTNLRGVLKNAFLDDSRIQFEPQEGRRLSLWIRDGMIDVVRSHFGGVLDLTIEYEGRRAYLVELSPVEE